ncbi:signal peptidase I [candidate division WOR-3 bacterium]|nr:signal peptidase I [candidate division WOR-3 bacterium]
MTKRKPVTPVTPVTPATHPTSAKSGGKGRKPKRTFWRGFWEFVRSWTTVIVIVLAIRAFGIESMVVPTGSMEHTILPGDFVLVNKFCYGFKAPFTNKNILGGRMPRSGEVIVFRYPRHPRWARPYERFKTIFPREFPLLPIHWDTKEKRFHWFAPENWVKRCVGLPGDTVEVLNKLVFVNNKPFEDEVKAVHKDPMSFPRLVPRDEFERRWMDLMVFMYSDSLYYADSSVYRSCRNFGKVRFDDLRSFYDSLFNALYYDGLLGKEFYSHYVASFYLHQEYSRYLEATRTSIELPPEGTFDLRSYYNELYQARYNDTLPATDSFFFASYILHYYMRDNFGPIVVPEGVVFGMGDNRDLSNDCRFWGFVPTEMLKGSPVVYYYSLGDETDRFGNKRSIPARVLNTHWDRIGRVVQ